MNTKFLTIALAGLVLAAGGGLVISAFTANQAKEASIQASSELSTATFSVTNMTCATCPATVKAAMSRVNGVRSVEVDFDSAAATVEFDATLTSPEQIAQASTAVGFPATPVS